MERTNNKLFIFLLSLGVLALIAAGCIFYAAWYRGTQADQAASLLLEQNREAFPENASTLHIPELDLELPVLWDFSQENLEVTVCRYRGPAPSEDGNLVITGHDFLSGAHFGNLGNIKRGDTVTVYDEAGQRFDYVVYDYVSISPNDVAALDDTSYERELTLMTCSDNANRRLLIRCYLDEPAAA